MTPSVYTEKLSERHPPRTPRIYTKEAEGTFAGHSAVIRESLRRDVGLAMVSK